MAVGVSLLGDIGLGVVALGMAWPRHHGGDVGMGLVASGTPWPWGCHHDGDVGVGVVA